ncbi:MAG: hypothetical protein J6T76_06140 [Paludibacteraceae bacterium]|nr:hypothetical protein [Paludibacteraceae bacterium]
MQPNDDIRARYAREYIPNAVFYIPFGYYYAVRLGTVWKLLSWMLIYIMPTVFYSWLTFDGVWWQFAVNYALVLMAVFSLYELGYIFNDTVAIRREQQPAIRLYEPNFRHFKQYMWVIVLVRLFYAVQAIGLLVLLNRQWHTTDSRHIWFVRACIICMLVVFCIYNNWRSKYNVWLYPLLVFSRYLPFMLLYRIDGWAILMLWLSFPMVNWLERFSMPRYRFPLMRKLIPTEQSKTLFRAVYYMVILMVPLVLPKPLIATYMYLFPIEILCFYRLMLLLVVKHHKPKNYLNG